MLRGKAKHCLIDLVDQCEQGLLQFLLVGHLSFVEPVAIIMSLQAAKKAKTCFRKVRTHTAMVERAASEADRHVASAVSFN